jgi:hypothetical protein
MARANNSSVDMNTGLKMAFMANVEQKKEKGYVQNKQAKGEVNASKGGKSATQKKKAKQKAKMAKQSRKKNK